MNNLYHVRTKEIHEGFYVVEARSEEEAMNKVFKGGFDKSEGSEFMRFLNAEDWEWTIEEL